MRNKSVGLALFLSAHALLSGGCAATPGQGFTLFPAGNFLLDTTKNLRSWAPCDADLPRELNRTLPPEYRVEPGDGLLLETEPLDSEVRLPADQTVLVDGMIDLGKYGRRVVAGRTVEEIEQEIVQLIRAGGDEKTSVNVRLSNVRGAVYYVLGEANSPGAFPLTGRETVLDGILAAGGINSKASDCNIILSRPTEPHGCRVVLPVCYRHITQMGDTSTNYQLQPGDRIYIATRTLCEQLTFWNDSKDCDFCCRCQHACPGGCVQPMAAPMGAYPGMIPQPAMPVVPQSARPPSRINGGATSRARPIPAPAPVQPAAFPPEVDTQATDGNDQE